MKKAIILLVFVFGCALYGHPQDKNNYPKNQVAVFYGAPSPYLILILLNMPSKDDHGTRYLDKFSYYSGIFNVQYMRTISKKIEVGMLANTERMGRLIKDDELNTSWIEDDVLWRLMCVMQFNFVKLGKARLYAKGGLGVAYFRNKNHVNDLNENEDFFWVLPCMNELFGVELGSGFLRPFAEVGYGAQGWASVGLRARF